MRDVATAAVTQLEADQPVGARRVVVEYRRAVGRDLVGLGPLAPDALDDIDRRAVVLDLDVAVAVLLPAALRAVGVLAGGAGERGLGDRRGRSGALVGVAVRAELLGTGQAHRDRRQSHQDADEKQRTDQPAAVPPARGGTVGLVEEREHVTLLSVGKVLRT